MYRNQKLRYLFFGLINTIFGYLCFVLLWSIFSHKLSDFTILTLSNILSVVYAFLNYNFFVFRSDGQILLKFSRFSLVYFVSYIFNIMTFPLLTENLKTNPYVAQAIIIAFIVILTYILNKNFTFRTN